MSGPSPENVQVESGTVLRRALREAVEDDLLKPNPADGVELPKVTRAKITTWTPAETRYALAELEKPLTAMVHVTATTGMRRSEVLGLRWDSVDLNSAHLEVTRTLVMVAGQPHFSELTKTRASRRRIALDRRTVEPILSHRVRQVQLRPDAGELSEKSLDLVFTDEIGQPFSPNRFTRSFQAEARRLERPPIGVLGLRHSLATTALADGVSPKIVSERLGHAWIATTLDRYSHMSEEQDREVSEALALRIAGE